MKKIVSLSLLLLLGFGGSRVSAQEFKTALKASPKGAVRCATVENETVLKSMYPERETTAEFEAWIDQKIKEDRAHASKNVNTLITIPVVVHILSNGDAIGTNENLSDARVFSQIQSLNQDFRMLFGTAGYNENPVGADMEIEFCLAQRKPDGTATNGIDRVTTSLASFPSRTDVETMKASTQWDPLQYFNIWVVNFSGSVNNLLGYAQFPSTSGLSGINANGGAANTDGVAISYMSFGNQSICPTGPYDATYNQGRTSTHEIGHCMGLRHIWGDGTGDYQTGVADCTATDYVADTPPAGYLHYGCDVGSDTCFDDYVDMIENYMDYSDDACMNIFTAGQKARMVAVMNNSVRRKELKTSLACSPPMSVVQQAFESSISIFPNPATTELNYVIRNNYEVSSIVMHDIAGKEVYRNDMANTPTQLSVSNLSSGVYFVTFSSGKNSVTKKFIKE